MSSSDVMSEFKRALQLNIRTKQLNEPKLPSPRRMITKSRDSTELVEDRAMNDLAFVR